jgi:hypothetical protein
MLGIKLNRLAKSVGVVYIEWPSAKSKTTAAALTLKYNSPALSTSAQNTLLQHLAF